MKKIAIVALLSAFAAAPAMAAEGYYAGVNVGSAKIDISGADNTTSLALLGGYTVNENFSAEAAYTNFGSKTYVGGTIKSHGISFSGVGSYPFSELFSVFGKLGVASTTIDVTANGLGSASGSTTKLTFGLGGQFTLNKQLAIRLGYDSYKVGDSGGTNDQKVTSIGGIYKF